MLVSPAARKADRATSYLAVNYPTPPPTYLANYPYLFVRETDQTDYLCTVCQETFKEDRLQTHLFHGHSAKNIQDCFVRLKQTGSRNKTLVSCVLCWAKLDSDVDMSAHRQTCKSTVCDEDMGGNEAMDPSSVMSTPDVDDMQEEDDRETNGVSPPPFPQPEVIIDTEIGEKYDPSHDTAYIQSHKMNGVMSRDPVYSSQCMQCSLCAMILPSTSYLSHLRAYHRVSCPLSNLNCPLCMTCVPIMDLTVHLASQHGLVPQTAVNALLLWVLTSNTFSLNEAAQESLKSKFKPTVSIQPKVKPSVTSTPLTSTSLTSTPVTSATPARSPSVHSPVSYNPPSAEQETPLLNDLRGKVPVEKLMCKLTRSHLGTGGKQSHQCLVCAKWYAVPPLRHMRSHIFTFRQEKRRILQLTNNANICLICYRIFESQQGVAGHLATHTEPDNAGSSTGVSHITIPGLPGGSVTPVTSSLTSNSGGLLAEALLGYPGYTKADQKPAEAEDSPLGNSFDVSPTALGNSYDVSPAASTKDEVNVELDNAGRVKSGKVRKQCELCGEWSNIKWFFKHMSEVHQALFCRCCREYLPKDEHKEHRHWHGMPPYMGQKIRIEEGQPIIIDRKERASLTPIGSLAAWGGSSGGLVVKAVDEMNRKRKVDRVSSPSGSNKSSSNGDSSLNQGRESLMPKERCPVCAIEITHKNLARHIKLRHGIKYKFCYKCRKLVPGDLYEEHRGLHESGELPSTNGGVEYLDNLQGGEDGMIEIPEEVLDEVMESNGSGIRKKDEGFRANTSMTKLESLMGKEFKHPRRQCNICGYSVSYSNYKRHLRNAHPGIIDESQKDDSGGENDGDMVGHHIDDSDRIEDNRGASDEDEDNVEEDVDAWEDKEGDVEGYSECSRCGDHVMSEFMDSHLKKVHGEVGSKAGSPRPRNLKLRSCPECGQDMREDSVIKHCKVKHKVIYRLCAACSKYIPKKLIKVHMKLHEKGDLDGKVDDVKVDEVDEGSRGSEQDDQDQQKQVSKMASEMSLEESDEVEMKDDDLSSNSKDDLEGESELVIDSV